MLIIEVAGGLGNQLQQYALYRKFVSLGRQARLDISWFREERQGKIPARRELELDYFEGLNYAVCTPEEKAGLTGGDGLSGKLRRKFRPSAVHHFRESRMYHPELFEYDQMYISGYFACEKYYADILGDLRERIKFPKSDNTLNAEMAARMKTTESVSVHVRRGDYLDPVNAEMFGNICTEEYYASAMDVIRKNCRKPHFYLFSDDPAYVKKHFKGAEYTLVDINHGKDSFYDMWLMSNCQHNICANSTFSFWGARLNRNADKIMIRPTIHKNSQAFDRREMEELWRGWRFISPQGNAY